MTAPASFAQLRLENVCQSFLSPEGRRVNALNNLNLTIQGGEFIALLGPSGCGKSTALNSLAGLIPLTGGGIWLDDRRIDVLPSEQRGFGMVFQSYALFPHMTVLDNVGFGLRMRGVDRSEIRRRAMLALELVQLTGHETKLPGQLSGGQQQRVAIARAIVIEPPLILMDEPLSNLDTRLRIEMRAEIRRIHTQLGRTTIYVTHDQDEALSMADRIVVMKEGVVQQVGTPEEVYEQPTNLHVARFMGYRNVLKGELQLTNATGQVAVQVGGLVWQGSVPRGLSLPERRAVHIALRPEDIIPVSAQANGAVPAEVKAMEYGGRESLLSLNTASGPLFARMQGHYHVGQHLHISVPSARALVYSEEG
ncbi:ABC transporter ATP-binding protein [Amphibiibacter pelophylacis]|uniref:ABC transporter ATP-binding protein n=1 Tax=Amphibiibacter pelophylacis TaxID=1799477 RepID=A0ACC6P1E9_9BURK